MILKHRDRELLRFEWIEPNGVRIVSVNETESRFLPLDFKRGTVNSVNGESLALQIIANLKVDPFVSYEELSELLDIPRRTLTRRMKELAEAGVIRRMGAAKNGYWQVRYENSKEGSGIMKKMMITCICALMASVAQAATETVNGVR